MTEQIIEEVVTEETVVAQDIENVEVEEQVVGALAKTKGFFKKHGKKIIIGAVAGLAVGYIYKKESERINEVIEAGLDEFEEIEITE